MTIPARVTLAVFSCGVGLGVLFILCGIVCCKIIKARRLNHTQGKKFFLSSEIEVEGSESKHPLESRENLSQFILPPKKYEDKKKLNLSVVCEDGVSRSSSSMCVDVPVVMSLQEIFDKEEKISIDDETEFTPMMAMRSVSKSGRFIHYVKVQLEKSGNKTYNFYQHYNGKKEREEEEKDKKIKLDFKENALDSLEQKKKTDLLKVECVGDNQMSPKVHFIPLLQKEKVLMLEKIIKRISTKHHSCESFFKKKSRLKKKKKVSSVPCLLSHSSLEIEGLEEAKGALKQLMPETNKIKSLLDKRGLDQQARRSSFRRKLHNARKYAEESLVEIEQENKNKKENSNEKEKTNSSNNINNSVLVPTHSQEMSKELWQLRALLANADDFDSEESLSNTPFTLETINYSLVTNSSANPSQDSFSHSLVEGENKELLKLETLTHSEKIEIEKLMTQAKSQSTLKIYESLLSHFLSSQVRDLHGLNLSPFSKKDFGTKPENKNISKKEEVETSNLNREPSIRRQTYRNALARRQEKQKKQQKTEPSSSLSTDKPSTTSSLNHSLVLPKGSEESQETESSLSMEKYLSTGGNSSTGGASLSFESFRAEDTNTSTDSTGDNHSCKLEKLRGDSGYKSLENQQSVNRHEMRSTVYFVPQESNIISEDETMVTTISSSSSTPNPILNNTRRVHSADENLMKGKQKEDKRVCCTQNVHSLKEIKHQKLGREPAEKKRILYKSDRQCGQIQESTTEPLKEGFSSPSFKQLVQSNSSLSSFSSSFFSRFLKTHTRRTLIRMQRDYSIDERSDALFNEFLRYDPALEMKHTLCVTRSSPKNRHRSGRNRTSHQTSRGYLAAEEGHLIRKQEKRQTFSKMDKISDLNIGSKAREFSVIAEINNHKIPENITNPQPTQLIRETRIPHSQPQQITCSSRSKKKEDSNDQQQSQRGIPVIQLTEEE